jgi:hypothetical protein
MKFSSFGGPLGERRNRLMLRVPAVPALTSRATILALSGGRLVSADERGGTARAKNAAYAWCFSGVVAITPSLKQVRHWASMKTDGDDLVIRSRNGYERAKSAHDGNLITFHRVRGFRDLVY